MAMVEVEEATVREIASLLKAIRDSATPGLAERITSLVGALGQVAAEVEPEPASSLVQAAMTNAPAITAMLNELGQWQRTGVWDSLTEAASLASALKDSATPAIAERLADLAVSLGNIAGEAGAGVAQTLGAAEANGPELAAMIRQLAAWQQDGTWDALMQLATLGKGLTDSLSPAIVERAVSFATDTIIELQQALDAGLLALGTRAMGALNASVQAASADKSRITVTGLLRSLKEPEIQYGVKVILGLVRRIAEVVPAGSR